MFKRLFREYRTHDFDLNHIIKDEWAGMSTNLDGWVQIVWEYYKCKKCKKDYKTTNKYNLIGLKGCDG